MYQSVRELLAVEPGNVEIVEVINGRSPIAVLAPHAGGIEPFTGELAKAIAGKIHRLYEFSGKAARDNFRFHVSSVRFDEPGLQNVLKGARTAISIHGAAGDEDAVTLIGGVNRRLIEAVRAKLESAGFAVMDAPTELAATDPRNLVNRVPEGGVQLELTRRLREDLRGGWLRRLRFECYVDAIRAALAQEMSRPGPAWDELRTQSASPAL
jgi:phage replication-related protein YjqB (UPF0714/DUF867 family)